MPHPSRGSRTEHEPEYTHAVESCPRRTGHNDWPDSERAVGETSAFHAEEDVMFDFPFPSVIEMRSDMEQPPTSCRYSSTIRNRRSQTGNSTG